MQLIIKGQENYILECNENNSIEEIKVRVKSKYLNFFYAFNDNLVIAFWTFIRMINNAKVNKSFREFIKCMQNFRLTIDIFIVCSIILKKIIFFFMVIFLIKI